MTALAIKAIADSDAATLGILEIVTAASDLDRARILALLRCRREMPSGIDAVVRVLGPDFAIRPDRQEPLGHARAAWHHTARSLAAVDKVRPEEATWPVDTGEGGTGELEIANAAGRLVMAGELVARGRR